MKSAKSKKNSFKYIAVLPEDHAAIMQKAKSRGEVTYAFIGKMFRIFLESEKNNGKTHA